MVAFNETAGSPSFVLAPNGSTATRKGRIAWTDIDAFIAQVFPPSFVSGTNNIQFGASQFPGKPYLYARSLRIEPSTEALTGPNTTEDFDTVATYTNPANVVVEYHTPEAPQSDDDNQDNDPVPFLTHNWSIGGEFMTLPNTGFRWDIDSAVVGADVKAGLFVPTIEHAITWPRVPSPPFAKMRTTVGKINSDVLNFATGTIAAETLFFLGAELKRDIMSDGTRAWEVTYRFSERIITAEDSNTATGTGKETGGWNHYYRGDSAVVNSPGFYRIFRQGTADGPYLETTFAELFNSA